MLATLPAVCSPPHSGHGTENRRFPLQYQSIMPAKSCSPGKQPGGGLKLLYYHRLMPAAAKPRLTTCSPLAGDTSSPSTQPLSSHHQKEAL